MTSPPSACQDYGAWTRWLQNDTHRNQELLHSLLAPGVRLAGHLALALVDRLGCSVVLDGVGAGSGLAGSVLHLPGFCEGLLQLLSRKANCRTYQSQGRGEGEDDEDNLHDDPLCVWLQIPVAVQH